MTRVLITGAGGFAGSHLVDECLNAGFSVHGTVHPSTTAPAHVRSEVQMHSTELLDAAQVDALVSRLCPDSLFHLAASAAVGSSWKDPAATLTNNILGTLNVLEAVRKGAPETRVLIVGSAEEYGLVPKERLPILEDEPLRPADPYGVSKVTCDLLGLQHYLAFKTHVVRVRPFNHIGPRQGKGFVLPDFASQIAAMETGALAPVLRVGNLQAARDFTDVRDMARAYRLVLERGVPGEVYNVCSSKAVRIADIVDTLIGCSTVHIQVEVDPARRRPTDHPTMVGSYAALQAATGWSPVIPIEQSIGDTLAYWRVAA